MDILYFLGYNLDEFLPWHSTLSRTRQRLPEHVFEKCFEKVLKICIEAGMVEGDVQAIDAAYIGANACLENMQPKDGNGPRNGHIFIETVCMIWRVKK